MLLLLAPGSKAFATDFYVSPTAGGSGNGSLGSPWTLATALAQPAAIRPGDTIWLRGGTYSGAFDSVLTGSLSAPIQLRSYPGEFARLDGGTIPATDLPTSVLTVEGAYAVYRDFEVMSSSNPAPDGGQGTRPQGLQVIGPDNKFINLVVHDLGQGFGFWEGAPDSEISGCLIYYNGNSTLDHGVYANNLTGTKRLLDNIVFRNYGLGIHAYTTNGHLNNFDIEGNVTFVNGRLNPTGAYKPNMLLGSGQAAATSCTSSPQVAQNPKFLDNYSYHPRGAGGRELDLGYSTGSCNPTATGNYLVGDTTLTLGPAFGTITLSGNTFYGSIAGFSSGSYPSNVYLSSRPTGVRVFLRPNPYEAGRAHVVVYNWDLSASVGVDLSSVLAPGTNFEIRNAQNYFASPVLSGTYNGGQVTLPLTGLTPATPVGQPTPGSTGPEFNVFVVRALAPMATPTPTATAPPPTPTPTPTRTPTPPPPSSTPTRTATAPPPSPTPTRTPTAPPPSRTPTRTATAPPPSPTPTRTSTPAPPTPTPTRTPTPKALFFYTTTPCRLVDTRLPSGPLGGPSLAAGASRTFVLVNQCGIPATARALSLNATVAGPTAPGYLTLYPGGTIRPTTSTVTYGVGRTRADHSIVSLGASGDLAVFCGQASGKVDLILDVGGYFQ